MGRDTTWFIQHRESERIVLNEWLHGSSASDMLLEWDDVDPEAFEAMGHYYEREVTPVWLSDWCEGCGWAIPHDLVASGQLAIRAKLYPLDRYRWWVAVDG
jgi:hypothetical protein